MSGSTTAILELPREEGPAAAQTRSLLIVDDDEGPRKTLSIIFKDHYDVLTAKDGASALAIANARRVDAAIVDIRMPGLSGIETLAGLKKIDPGIEVVILTAYETLETARNSLRMGACDYLTKPFELPTMRAAVARAMERRFVSDRVADGHRELEELRRTVYDFKVGEQTAKAKGEIYASVIHDINGPMTVISGFIDIVNNNLAGSEGVEGVQLEELKNHLAQITRQVDACIDISRRYLDFFRERRERSAVVRVNQALQDLVDLLRVHPAAKGNKVALEKLDVDASIAINGTDFIQCLLNLAINGLQCIDRPHAVTIVVRRMEKPLDVGDIPDLPGDRLINVGGLKGEEPLIAVAVSDDGDGIPDEVAGQLFESYVTTKSEGKGTGLGLAIVQRFVREAGGAIRLESKRGLGTTFTLLFPEFKAQGQG